MGTYRYHPPLTQQEITRRVLACRDVADAGLGTAKAAERLNMHINRVSTFLREHAPALRKRLNENGYRNRAGSVPRAEIIRRLERLAQDEASGYPLSTSATWLGLEHHCLRTWAKRYLGGDAAETALDELLDVE